MKPLWISALTLAILLLAAAPVGAQPVISARSGVIAYGEGTVYLGDKLWEPSNSQFDTVKENTVVRTGAGRVEVLLVPGTFLRLGENSSFRLLTNRLIDTRLELLGGSAVLEIDQVTKDDNVTVVSRDATLTFPRAGLYRLDSEPARLKVLKGSGAVQIGDRRVEVSSGKMLGLTGETASLEKFDAEDTDSLDNWSHRRGDLVASANVYAAKYARDNSMGLSSNSWAWNPYFGMYTFLPMGGQMFSPYGGWFWSPMTVMGAYYNPPFVARGGGSSGGLGSPVAIASTGASRATVPARSMSTSPMANTGSGAASSGAASSGAVSSGTPSSGGLSSGGHAGAGHR